jgi:hypothetical protein
MFQRELCSWQTVLLYVITRNTIDTSKSYEDVYGTDTVSKVWKALKNRKKN